MIKVIHVLTDTNIGGAGIWLMNFLRAYDRNKLDVSVALPEHALLEDRIRSIGITVHTVKSIADSSFSKKGTAEFIKLFKKEKPDIVHCHASLSARIAAKRCGIAVVNTRHCLENAKPFPKNIVYGTVNSVLSDAVIAVSGAVADNLKRDGIPVKKLHLVYNGVTPLSKISPDEKSAKRKELGIPDNHTVVGIVARLEPVKRHDIFIEAAKILEKERITFLIVGSGSLEKELKTKVSSLGLDGKVIFTGHIENVSEIADIIDIYALTSESEACPLSLIEAMTLGKPCVSTDSGGPSEVISDTVNGYITPNGNAAAFAEKIKLLADSPDMRISFGNAAKEIAETKFSVETMADKITAIYESLVNAR